MIIQLGDGFDGSASDFGKKFGRDVNACRVSALVPERWHRLAAATDGTAVLREPGS
jgi:hypothetical protein